MLLDYIPLLQTQRDLQGLPRDLSRFQKYLGTLLSDEAVDLPPLGIMNPMAKDHVTALLDDYLALDADAIATHALAKAAPEVTADSGDFRVGLVVADDLMGGWTNRYDYEYKLRFPDGPARTTLPPWLKHHWITAVLWSSEPASTRAIREAVLTAIYRVAYLQRHGCARTLREMLVQEGRVMAKAGCAGPTLDPDEIEYTREVLVPFLDASDKRTIIECLFGDKAGRTLGFTPRGLDPWAGLALALHDARTERSSASRSEVKVLIKEKGITKGRPL